MAEIVMTLPKASLRAMRYADAESIAEHANDRRVWAHLRDRFPFPYSPEDAIEFIDLIAKDEKPLHFGIDVDGDIVGAVGLSLQTDIERLSAEIGYWLGYSFWGKGIMPDVVRAMTGYGHRTLGLRRIYAKVMAGNPRSERVLTKAGYLFEGRLRSGAIKDGQVRDVMLYSSVSGG